MLIWLSAISLFFGFGGMDRMSKREKLYFFNKEKYNMNKEDFILGDYNYETEVNGILVSINKDTMSERTVDYANRILELYLSKKTEILEHIINDALLEFYGDWYTRDEIIEKLNEANIEIIEENWGKLIWLNHELDDDHIIEVEFNNDMELSYVSIDG